ncbi:hypothetical protein L6452_13253 [Arctium lappa]|uniref:Uncharacterized protein n=1 Tax=Arctium lappa TaxID=4217 RepID=A0ACB9CI24_ARCLA|nr:hypothetical protein L6452_13253 [Arctium lappa]
MNLRSANTNRNSPTAPTVPIAILLPPQQVLESTTSSAILLRKQPASQQLAKPADDREKTATPSVPLLAAEIESNSHGPSSLVTPFCDRELPKTEVRRRPKKAPAA